MKKIFFIIFYFNFLNAFMGINNLNIKNKDENKIINMKKIENNINVITSFEASIILNNWTI